MAIVSLNEEMEVMEFIDQEVNLKVPTQAKLILFSYYPFPKNVCDQEFQVRY